MRGNDTLFQEFPALPRTMLDYHNLLTWSRSDMSPSGYDIIPL